MKFLVCAGRVLDPKSGTDRVADVLIDGERVVGIAKPGTLKTDGGRVIDAKGKLVLPGLVDLHVHFREPGQEYKEDIESGSRAAVAGGFTTVVTMANTEPVVDNAELVHFIKRRGEQVGLCRVLPVGAVTVGLQGEQLAPMGEMKNAGAVAVSDDGKPVPSASLMRRALEYAQLHGLQVLTHAEEPTLSKRGQMHEGKMSTRLGLKGLARVAEDMAVVRDLMLAEYTGARLHVCHVSTAGAVEAVRQAKRRGVQVTAEATPHHFTLTCDAVSQYDTNTKMRPPLREESDRQAVIAGLADGTLDAIATDHAPHSVMEKDVAFEEAQNGIVGLQTSLSLALDLYRTGVMPLLTVVERMTCGPARVLGLPLGELVDGGPADLTIVDPEAFWTLTPAGIFSKSKNSPFLGKKLCGQVEVTMFAGKIVYDRKARE